MNEASVRNRVAMRRRHLVLTAVLVAGALLTPVVVAGAFAPNAAATWRAPVNGAVTQDFDYRREAPFERGARRGVRFAAHAGQKVRAACSGTVTFAGATPAGQVVSVRCGSLVATHLGLAEVRIAARDRVSAGQPIATAGANGVGLGARHADDRWGYFDPLGLIAPRAPDLGPAPARRSPRESGSPARPASAPVRVTEPRPEASPSNNAPLVAWGALALMAAGLGGVAGGLGLGVGSGLVSSVRRRWRPSTSPRRSTM